MNVWLLQIGEVLPVDHNARKLRTALLAEKLVKKDHSVFWWASAFDHFKKDWIFKDETLIEVNRGLKVMALKGFGYKRNISLRRFMDHRIIASRFKAKAIAEPRPDIIVASMPSHDLAYEAVMFGKENNIPVIVDIRDPWPDIFLELVPVFLRGLARLVLNRDFRMTRNTMRDADGITAMTSTLLDWGLKCAGREGTWKDKVFYLGGTSTDRKPGGAERMPGFLKDLNFKFIVTFIGTLARYHNPSILLDVAERLKNTGIGFIIAGDGELFGKIKSKVAGLKNVILPGWLKQDEITALLQHSSVGVCPSDHVADFFPNKAFTYLSAGLPVISGFQGDLRTLIEKRGIGFYYPPNDVEAISNCIKKLYNDPEIYKKTSENAKTVFNEMLDANKIYEEYIRYMEKIVSEYNKKDHVNKRVRA